MLTKRSAVYVKVLINRQVSGLAKTQPGSFRSGHQKSPDFEDHEKGDQW